MNHFSTPLWLQREGVESYFRAIGILTPQLSKIIKSADQRKLDKFTAAIARVNGDDTRGDD